MGIYVEVGTLYITSTAYAHDMSQANAIGRRCQGGGAAEALDNSGGSHRGPRHGEPFMGRARAPAHEGINSKGNIIRYNWYISPYLIYVRFGYKWCLLFVHIYNMCTIMYCRPRAIYVYIHIFI